MRKIRFTAEIDVDDIDCPNNVIGILKRNNSYLQNFGESIIKKFNVLNEETLNNDYTDKTMSCPQCKKGILSFEKFKSESVSIYRCIMCGSKFAVKDNVIQGKYTEKIIFTNAEGKKSEITGFINTKMLEAKPNQKCYIKINGEEIEGTIRVETCIKVLEDSKNPNK